MKKFLLALTFLCVAFIGRSQTTPDKRVILNELYTSPTEYIELYNTSTDVVDIGCYTIVTYTKRKTGANGNPNYFQVYTIPPGTTSKINPHSYFLLAASSSFTLPSRTGAFTPNINWNTSGIFTNYTLNNGATQVSTTTTNYTSTNFLTDDNLTFLFDANGNYISGFQGNAGSATITSAIVPSFQFSVTGACTVNINTALITSAEFRTANDGNANGFYRVSDGRCGTWAKEANNSDPSPGTPNSGGSTTATDQVTATESITCGGSTVVFKITNVTNGTTSYPLYVDLYYDANNNGIADAGEYQSTKIITTTTLPYTDNFTITPGATPIIIYRTTLGCVARIGKPTSSTPSLTSTQVYVCGKRVDYTINGTGTASTYSLPLKVTLYYDADNNGSLDAGETTVLGTATVNALPANGSFNLAVADQNKSVIVVYTPAFTCAAIPPVAPRVATGTLVPNPTYLCNNLTVNVTPSNTDAATYGAALHVALYVDKNKTGVLASNDTSGQSVASYDFTTLTANTLATKSFTISGNAVGKDIFVVYSSPNSCFTPAVQLLKYDNKGPITVGGDLHYYTVSYFVVSGAANTNPQAFPMTIKVYEDKDSNGVIGAGDSLLKTQVLSTPDYSTKVVAIGKYGSLAIITASSNTGCATGTFAITSNLSPLPVHFVSFSAVRKDENKVNLAWTTATEQDNRGFYVQRSTGNEWKDVGFVFSQAPNGTSTQNLSYSFTDLNPSKGVSQYRILQVDLDGKGRYSETRSVHGNGAASKMLLFPNPSSTGSVTLVFDREAARTITVSDVSGRTVQQFKNIMNSSQEIKNLGSGFYTVQVTDVAAGTTDAAKFIIKKR